MALKGDRLRMKREKVPYVTSIHSFIDKGRNTCIALLRIIVVGFPWWMGLWMRNGSFDTCLFVPVGIHAFLFPPTIPWITPQGLWRVGPWDRGSRVNGNSGPGRGWDNRGRGENLLFCSVLFRSVPYSIFPLFYSVFLLFGYWYLLSHYLYLLDCCILSEWIPATFVSDWVG